MSDAIEVKGLRVLGVHGVLEHEQESAQPFEIDLRVEADLTVPAASDKLVDAVDYAALCNEVAEIVANSSFALIESLAEAIATKVLEDRRVLLVKVNVRKLRPPMALDLATVGVSVTRTNSTVS